MITLAGAKLFFKGVWKVLAAIPWQAYAIIGFAGLLIWRDHIVFERGYALANTEWRAKYDKDMADYKDKLIAAQTKAAADLAAANVRMGEIERQSLADKEAINEEHQKELAALRAGDLRVRSRFQCPAATGTNRVPGTAGTSGGRDAAGQAGFNAEDAGVALGIARDGDAAILQLRRAQEVIREYQQICR